MFDKDNEIINWLDKNHIAENKTFVYQQKVLNKVCIPIVTKLYQSTEANQKKKKKTFKCFPGAEIFYLDLLLLDPSLKRLIKPTRT